MSNLALMTKVLAKYLIPGSHFVANNFFDVCLEMKNYSWAITLTWHSYRLSKKFLAVDLTSDG